MKKQKRIIRSGLFYHGNKYRLLKHFLKDLFPTSINTFIDVFGGSGTVSINVDAKNYYINDYDEITIRILNLFKTLKTEEIIYEIEKYTDIYDLPKSTTYRKSSKDEIEQYKSNFYEFRKIDRKSVV